jgi:branched-chain amino acid transport system permease protein
MNRYADITLALLAAALIVVLSWAVPWLRFVMTIALAKGLAVLGILLLLRAGQVSFGHALYLSLAAYVVAFGAVRVPEVLLLLPIAAAAAAVVGLVIGLFVSRYRAISMVFYSLVDKFYEITRGGDGIRVPATTFAGASLSPEQQSWALLGLALTLAFGFGAFVKSYLASPMGSALSALKTREARLEFMGIPARRVLLSAYVISAFMAGCGGVLIALSTRHVTPALAYWTASGELVFIAVLGGGGSVFGPFLGALAYELTRTYAAALVADAWQMILGTVLLVVILFAPGGLWGMGRALIMRRRQA